MNKKIVIIGAGVAGINAATKLVDNGYPGELITIIDKGKNPHDRLPEEVMTGMLGAGGWSDGKLTYHTSIGGQLSKYCGEEKAYELMDQVISNFRRFHPKPEEIFMSDPQEEPDFIKPYFGLRLFPVWHIGSNYLHEIAKAWYSYLVDKGVSFLWEHEVTGINFDKNEFYYKFKYSPETGKHKGQIYVGSDFNDFDKLIFAVGKSGIDFGKQLADEYNLPTEPKSVQIGVRFEAPQKYFQKLIDISYDFKLYQKHYPKVKYPENLSEEEYKKFFESKSGLNFDRFDEAIKNIKEENSISIRSFCTNNNAAYVAVEETYGDISYNGHAKKGKEFENGMTNFGILMEIKGIENPFEWSREVVKKVQAGLTNTLNPINFKTTGLYYSPNYIRKPSQTSEGSIINTIQIPNLDIFKEAFGEYADYILNFINQMNEVFEFGDDFGIYIPEVKYLSPEPLVNYNDLSLINYNNIHFVGDALSARGITISGAQGIYVAESILKGN